MKHQWNRDCKEFNGIYSCEVMTAEDYKDCSECSFYEKIGKKILILKLGAMGDVVRTTSLLTVLKKKYGRDSHITWVVEENSKEILYNNSDVDRILGYNPETALLLNQEKFDVLLSLEIFPPITLVTNRTKKVIGINVGSAGRWPSKAWHPSKIIELIKKLNNYNVILLGGKRETELIKEIEEGLGNVKVMKNDVNNSVREFIGVLNNCDVVITGDSLALHLALGLKKNTIGLFFCTPPWQVEDYKYLKKINSPLLENYFMDDRYIEELVKSIDSECVLEAVKQLSG